MNEIIARSKFLVPEFSSKVRTFPGSIECKQINKMYDKDVLLLPVGRLTQIKVEQRSLSTAKDYKNLA